MIIGIASFLAKLRTHKVKPDGLVILIFVYLLPVGFLVLLRLGLAKSSAPGIGASLADGIVFWVFALLIFSVDFLISLFAVQWCFYPRESVSSLPTSSKTSESGECSEPSEGSWSEVKTYLPRLVGLVLLILLLVQSLRSFLEGLLLVEGRTTAESALSFAVFVGLV